MIRNTKVSLLTHRYRHRSKQNHQPQSYIHRFCIHIVIIIKAMTTTQKLNKIFRIKLKGSSATIFDVMRSKTMCEKCFKPM